MSMAFKNKIVHFFLILIFAFQLLPVKQTIGYLLDNPSSEELADMEKEPSKNTKIWGEEDYDNDSYIHPCVSLVFGINNKAFVPVNEALPINYIQDIQTPPPNAPKS